jgi:cyclopropane fatty-acyl-phospholipid synthase-like methyltransferase
MSTAPFHKQPVNPLRHNDKRKIVEHYDFVSPYYRSLWGEHLHHGYWIRGDESKERAQLQLAEHLAELANVQTGSTVLDIGCGLGGSSIYLAQKYKARAIGITISPAGGNGQKGGSRCPVGRAVPSDGRRSLGFPGVV